LLGFFVFFEIGEWQEMLLAFLWDWWICWLLAGARAEQARPLQVRTSRSAFLGFV
jgi:hypothetical protein